MLEEIRRMGEEVDRLWDKKGRKVDAFPAIATQVLQSSKIFQDFDRKKFLALFWKQKKLPKQLDPHWGFGHPPLTFYKRRGFVIDLYFWVDPLTAIHTHGFRGAFGVLEGKSLHYRYDFETHENWKDRLWIGDLRLKKTELLHRGEIETIVPGTNFIHQVAHISRPSVSIVIRTDKEKLIQLTYRSPSLAYLAHRKFGETLNKKLLTLLMMCRLEDPARGDFLEELILGVDPGEAVYLLTSYFEQTLDLPLIERILEKTEPLKTWSKEILASLQEIKETRVRWPLIKEEGERFLASLLYSQVGREEIERLTTIYLPDRNPQEAVVQWLQGLLEGEKINLKLNESAREILSFLSRGYSRKRICEELAKIYEMEVTDSLRNDVDRSSAELEKIPLLKPLLPTEDRLAIAS